MATAVISAEWLNAHFTVFPTTLAINSLVFSVELPVISSEFTAIIIRPF